MQIFLVVSNPRKWPLKIPGVEIIQAKRYLTEPAYSRLTNVRVFNLSSSYRYQSLGYYVSLLAAARGHRPIPDITTIRDLQTPSMLRMVSEDFEEVINHALGPIKGTKFIMSIYFGRNMARRYDQLARILFNAFPAPLLRAEFVKTKEWQLRNLDAEGFSDIPESHFGFVIESATKYFSGKGQRSTRRIVPKYSLAILHKPDDKEPPSNEQALKRFIQAGNKLGIEAELITRDDFGRLAEFDALFLRETTRVTDHTFRFARRAEAENMVVIDDPQSIIKCANKVYLAEMLARQKIRTPKTLIVHRDNVDIVSYELGLPCVLKRPDSSFSMGVIKVNTRDELEAAALDMLDKSELVIAQEFLPTDFDWRVGILDGEPLYVCRYYMAPKHWQIIRRDPRGRKHDGNSETMAVSAAPAGAVQAALRACRPIGNGLYGVDIKQKGDRFYTVEINDNPNLDSGVEDEVLKDDLYLKIMGVFLKRLQAIK